MEHTYLKFNDHFDIQERADRRFRTDPRSLFV